MSIWSADGVELEILHPKICNLLPRGAENTGRYSVICSSGTGDVVTNVNIVSGQLSSAYSRNPGVYGGLALAPSQNTSHDLESRLEDESETQLRIGSVVSSKFRLEKLVDTKEAAWSPDGLWLAALDTNGAGYKVGFWTAHGKPMRIFSEDNYVSGREPTSIAWSLDAGDRKPLLFVGDTVEEVSVFDTLAFRPAVRLKHGAVETDTCIWEAADDFDDNVSAYKLLKLPWQPRGSDKKDIAMVISDDYSFLATRPASLPRSVWIWSLDEMVLLAVLLHNQPIRSMTWSPNLQRLLVILESSETFGVWDSQVRAPLHIRFSGIGITGGRWLDDSTLILWSRSQFVVVPLDYILPTSQTEEEGLGESTPQVVSSYEFQDSVVPDYDDTFAARR
jgi:WD40 repeat protein